MDVLTSYVNVQNLARGMSVVGHGVVEGTSHHSSENVTYIWFEGFPSRVPFDADIQVEVEVP